MGLKCVIFCLMLFAINSVLSDEASWDNYDYDGGLKGGKYIYVWQKDLRGNWEKKRKVPPSEAHDVEDTTYWTLIDIPGWDVKNSSEDTGSKEELSKYSYLMGK